MWAGLLLMVLLWHAPTNAHFGSCEDHTPKCRTYAANGLCRKMQQFMLQNCPVSCNTCLDEGCYDRNRLCGKWASEGHCGRPQVKEVCPHSCDACVIDVPSLQTFTQGRTIVRPDFECGRGIPAPAANRKRVARQIVFPDEVAGLQDKDTPLPLQNLNQQEKPKSPSDVIMMLPSTVDRMTPESTSDVQVEDTFCGATPICDRFLLTAAHCVIDPDRPVRTVRLGELDFSTDNEKNSKPVDYEVEQIIVHPDFDPNSTVRYNDLAILQTVEVIEFNEVVFPYCLTDQRPPPKTIVTGAGFGFVNATHRSSRLQEAELELVDTTECEDIYRRESHEPQLRVRYPDLLQNRDIMCAAYPERDACQGDSGGPLFLDRDGRRFLVGVVGSGVSCRGNSVSILPGLYISVADHIDFIDSVVYGGFR